jgi:hypothetical protein
MTTTALLPHETALSKPKPVPWRGLRRERALPITVGDARRLSDLRDFAAAPTLVWTAQPDGVKIEVHAPGASVVNTQVVFDPSRERLVVGVWAPQAPDGYRGRPELTYYRPIRVAGYDAARATANVQRGVITFFLPRP